MKTTIRYSPGMGNGIFADKNISEGELILHEHSIYVHPEEMKLLRDLPLGQYPFEFPDGSGRIVLGHASLINHSRAPNVKKSWDDGWLSIIALRDIGEGEELYHDYQFDPGTEPDWASN